MPADLIIGVDEMNILVPALAEHDGALQASGPGTDDENALVLCPGLRDPLRMPPAPVFLAGRGVLRADEVPPGVDPRDAHVAADALADVVEPALLDLLRQERVGDR